MLPHDSPPCVPDTECRVEIDGVTGIVQPAGTMLNQNSLHVLTVADSEFDTIKYVNYYTNDRLSYSTATLQPFDLRYASSPGQKLTRVAHYVSGQQVVFNQQTPVDFGDSFPNFVFRLSKESPILFYPVAAMILGLGILIFIVAPFRIWLKHYEYRVYHGIIAKERTPLQRFFQDIYYAFTSSEDVAKLVQKTKQIALYLSLLGAIIIGVISFDRYIITLFTVDGQSMEANYFTGNLLAVNRTPVTLAHLGGAEFVPQRGDVVIVRSVFGNVTTYDESFENTILIKRVLALPGERVVIKNGTLLVYNKDNPKGFEPDANSPWEKRMTHDLPSENLDIQLGVGELFVSGDNRPESLDSRFNGPLKTKEIIGVAGVKLWPLTKQQSTNELLNEVQ